jgi:hypothetical protein
MKWLIKRILQKYLLPILPVRYRAQFRFYIQKHFGVIDLEVLHLEGILLARRRLAVDIGANYGCYF